jgi:flavin-dependent dehydrogenase
MRRGPDDRYGPDVAIIGGGPAGAAAARMLACWGHRVLLIARGGDPVRGFTESLPPSTAPLLREIGVLDTLRRSTSIPTYGNTVWWGARAGAREAFPQTEGSVGYQVFRPDFDRLMLDHAAAAGVRIWPNAAVRNVVPATDGIQLEIRDADGGASEVAARYVVDCSGRSGVIARKGWRRYERAFRGQALIGAWRDTAPLPLVSAGDTLVESFADGWGWSVPCPGGARHVGILVDQRVGTVPRGRHFGETYRAVLRALPRLAEIMAGARFERAWACDASVYDAACCADGRILIAGDAASFIEPLSSFGVKKALASGWTAAVAVHTSIVHPARRSLALSFFTAWERRAFASARARSIEYAAEAWAHHRSAFWEARAAAVQAAPDLDDTSDQSLLAGADVRAAHEALRSSSACVLAERAVRFAKKPIIVGHEIDVEQALVLDGVASPVRFVRGVDLLSLVSAARGRTDAGSIIAAYIARHPLPVPDVVGALTLLAARGVVRIDRQATPTETS